MGKLTCAGLFATLGLTAYACAPGRGSSGSGTGGGAGMVADGGNGAGGNPGKGGAMSGSGGASGGGAGGTSGSGGAAGGSGGGGGGGGASGQGGGSGGGVAGGTGGNGGNAGTGGAPSACPTALYCDDFEAYPLGQPPGAPWTNELSAGCTVAVDTTQFRSGAKSVKVFSSGGGKAAFIHLMSANVLPVMPNNFFGRMMFRLEAAPTTAVHWTFIEGSGLLPGQNYHAVYRYGGQHPVLNGMTFVGSQLMSNYDTPDNQIGIGPKTDCWKHANQVIVPVGKWSCAEWQFDGTTNTLRLWIDGTAVSGLTITNTGSGCVNQPANYVWAAPTFDRASFGWESHQPDGARTIWIDDIVLSKTKIGCP